MSITSSDKWIHLEGGRVTATRRQRRQAERDQREDAYGVVRVHIRILLSPRVLLHKILRLLADNLSEPKGRRRRFWPRTARGQGCRSPAPRLWMPAFASMTMAAQRTSLWGGLLTAPLGRPKVSRIKRHEETLNRITLLWDGRLRCGRVSRPVHSTDRRSQD